MAIFPDANKDEQKILAAIYYLVKECNMSGFQLLSHQKLTMFALLDEGVWRVHENMPYNYDDGVWVKKDEVHAQPELLYFLTATEGAFVCLADDVDLRWDPVKVRDCRRTLQWGFIAELECGFRSGMCFTRYRIRQTERVLFSICNPG